MSTPIDPMSAAARPPAQELEFLGLCIDMLDADRLRGWAENIDTFGADLTLWSSPTFVAAKMRELAGHVEQAVRDIGVLRQRAASPAPQVSPEQVRQLVTFANDVLSGYDSGEVGDIDGGWLEDRAVELGLLTPMGQDSGMYVKADWLLTGASASRGPSSPEFISRSQEKRVTHMRKPKGASASQEPPR